MMKKYAAAICVLLMLLSSTAYYFYFAIQQVSNKIEKRQQLLATPISELDKLEISISDFENAKIDEHEILVSGRMFDISKVIDKGYGEVIVYGLYDEDEDELLAFLDSLTADDNQGCAPDFILTSLQLYFELLPAENFLTKHIAASIEGCTPYFHFEKEITTDILCPPPRLFLIA
jgi:hypothetical protein